MKVENTSIYFVNQKSLITFMNSQHENTNLKTGLNALLKVLAYKNKSESNISILS